MIGAGRRQPEPEGALMAPSTLDLVIPEPSAPGGPCSDGPMSVEERLWSKIRIDWRTGCWAWTASLNAGGYGQFRLDSRRRAARAHRVVYELLVGPIPDGLQLDHLCRNRACVNPAHLEPVTNKENQRRGIKGELTTHCPQGHPYDEANTYRNPSGRRNCKACQREQERVRRATARAARTAVKSIDEGAA